ncbi:hypothetical protein LCGC14_1494850 [marine sediment metagenome]|uniref:Uncharacterized protein n=1 Tax=marine sediment metagenome TaxID=412755 RepID=A0A0F9JRL5_9ZZZZ
MKRRRRILGQPRRVQRDTDEKCGSCHEPIEPKAEDLWLIQHGSLDQHGVFIPSDTGAMYHEDCWEETPQREELWQERKEEVKP